MITSYESQGSKANKLKYIKQWYLLGIFNIINVYYNMIKFLQFFGFLSLIIVTSLAHSSKMEEVDPFVS